MKVTNLLNFFRRHVLYLLAGKFLLHMLAGNFLTLKGSYCIKLYQEEIILQSNRDFTISMTS